MERQKCLTCAKTVVEPRTAAQSFQSLSIALLTNGSQFRVRTGEARFFRSQRFNTPPNVHYHLFTFPWSHGLAADVGSRWPAWPSAGAIKPDVSTRGVRGYSVACCPAANAARRWWCGQALGTGGAGFRPSGARTRSWWWRTAGSWSEMQAFGGQDPGRFVNSGFNILRAPNIFDLDLAVMKLFKVWEKTTPVHRPRGQWCPLLVCAARLAGRQKSSRADRQCHWLPGQAPPDPFRRQYAQQLGKDRDR
jgi:hypothetical protein